MDYKLDYISRLLTKISHKRLETYALTRLWHKLDNPDLHFSLQQYVATGKGEHALADVYLPQLNLSVEVNEPYHYKNREADAVRNAAIAAHGIEQLHIDCYDVVDDTAVCCSLETLNARVDAVAEVIARRIADMGADFKPWEPTKSVEALRAAGVLRVSDGVYLPTIDDIAALFGTRPKHRGFLRASGVGVPGRPGDVVWWPNTKHAKWENTLVDDQTITETLRHGTQRERAAHVKQHAGSNERRIVFLRDQNFLGLTAYTFKGVFAMHKARSVSENKCVWERIADFYNLNIDEQ